VTLLRGDVVLVAFPNSDLVTYKSRPALVVQDLRVETGIPQVVMVLITTNLGRKGPTRVVVSGHSAAGMTMGLLSDSVIVTDALQTVHRTAIRTKIGTCPMIREVDAALRVTLGL